MAHQEKLGEQKAFNSNSRCCLGVILSIELISYMFFVAQRTKRPARGKNSRRCICLGIVKTISFSLQRLVACH